MIILLVSIMTTHRGSCNVFITYEHITHFIPDTRRRERKCILHDLSGKINFGEMTAILGPSGSGKTSLMNILSGYTDFGSNRKHIITGKIIMNGKDRNRNLIRKLSSYIMQQDELLPAFTVKETLMMATNLKFSEKIPLNEKQQMVQENLEKVGLKNCQNTKVKSISGGERKRICIALELISNPPILFLDEPTSGLDSASSYETIALLKSLVNSGHTIICTIHQPSSKMLENFHRLIILTNGKCIYQGATNKLLSFLESVNLHCPKHYNPVDFVLNMASQRSDRYLATFLTALEKRKLNDFLYNNIEFDDDCQSVILAQNNISNDYPTCNWTQYRILLTREIISSVRNKWTMCIRLLFHIITGLLIGTLYYDIGNNAKKTMMNVGSLCFTQIFIMVSTAMTRIIQFPMDRKIIVREQVNNWYHLRNYYFAKTTADLPFQTVFTIIFCTLYYWMSSQPYESFRYLYFIAISVLASITSMSYGIMFGAGTSIEAAVCLSVVFAIPVAGFSGLFIRFTAMPRFLRWISSVSYLAYAFEGIIVTIYGYNRTELECRDDDLCLFSKPTLILDELGINNEAIYIDFIGILISFFFFRILTYVILYWKFKTE